MPPATTRRRWSCSDNYRTETTSLALILPHSQVSGPEAREGLMEKIDDGLKALLESGKEKGYLTYSQVNDHLPDDDANPEKIDQLLLMLEEQGIELIDEAEAEEREGVPVLDDEVRAELDLSFMDDE